MAKNCVTKEEKIISKIVDTATYEQLEKFVNSFELDKLAIIRIIDSKLNKQFGGKIDNCTLDKLISLYKFIADKFSDSVGYKNVIDKAMKIEKEYESNLDKIRNADRFESDKEYYMREYHSANRKYEELKKSTQDYEDIKWNYTCSLNTIKDFDENLKKAKEENAKLKDEINALKKQKNLVSDKKKTSKESSSIFDIDPCCCETEENK